DHPLQAPSVTPYSRGVRLRTSYRRFGLDRLFVMLLPCTAVALVEPVVLIINTKISILSVFID
ncbi:MAG: hypothetical protein MUP09_04400, partial [Thiovulaceae bacterium]|nr:hypothetical protein [Sulfurimonadaceae bacterium]